MCCHFINQKEHSAALVNYGSPKDHAITHIKALLDPGALSVNRKMLYPEVKILKFVC